MLPPVARSSYVLLKDFGRYAEEATAAIKSNAERIAREAGRPFEYLESAHTAARGCSHLYRVTPKGQRLMAASLQVRDKDFPAAFQAAA